MAIELSEAARALLLAVAQDPSGLILRLTAVGGSAILKTNDRIFGDGTPGEQARWESGIQELIRRGLIEVQGDRGRVLRITEEGHGAASGLRRRRRPAMLNIILTASARQCLLDAVMPGSQAYRALLVATALPSPVSPGDRVVMIQCERDEASTLLVLAKMFCPGAVSSIERAIIEARGRSAPEST